MFMFDSLSHWYMRRREPDNNTTVDIKLHPVNMNLKGHICL